MVYNTKVKKKPRRWGGFEGVSQQMERGAGILMHIASLPGPFGIGVFGEEAIRFAEQLKKMGMKYWQVLPFSYPGVGDSPYQSFSAFAGNPLFIDPRRLMRKGLLTADEVVRAEYNVNKRKIDYDYLRGAKENLLRTAFSRVGDEMNAEIDKFLGENKWADDVALYSAIKDDNYRNAWWDWQDEKLKAHDEKALKEWRSKENYRFYAFVEYIFRSEWAEIKAEINALGIKIIGDMPFYVSGDSADVWASRELFKMNTDKDSKYVFEKVAGVPPDYFCADGQLWGNPIYDWDKHKQTKYAWWMNRIAENYELYDYLRVDHFRAFSSYWEVPADAATAKEGTWIKGPGMDFFKQMDKTFGGSERLFAEDLGEMTEDLKEFMVECGLPGMKVMQFGFNPNDNSFHMPHNYSKNCVAYTGTHDNNTLLGWLWETSESERNECLKYCGFEGNNWGDGGSRSASCRAIIRTLWQTSADSVLVPIQDALGYGGDTRINVPGTPNGNWAVRFTSEDLASIDNEWFFELNRLYRRL